MSDPGDFSATAVKAVMVAVNGVPGRSSGSGSRRAVQWTVENLLPGAGRLLLVHVMPKITSIPTPLGDGVPVSALDANVVALYRHDMKEKFDQIFVPFKKLCRKNKVETLVLEDDNPATALVRYISESDIKTLVLGSCSSNFMTRFSPLLDSCSSNFMTRKLKGPGVPTTVLRNAPNSCNIFIISKRRIIKRTTSSSPTSETNSQQCIPSESNYEVGAGRLCSSSAESEGSNRIVYSERIHDDLENKREIDSSKLDFAVSETEQVDMQREIESLQLDLENTVAMHKRTCEELVHTHNKVRSLSSECHEETRRVKSAMEREEDLRKIAAEEKAKHLETMKALEEAKALLAKEAYERQLAEQNALKVSLEKQRIVDALISSDKRYRRYTGEEIEIATDFFSEMNMIGQGGYGKVYKCYLDGTLVAVKVLQPGEFDKKTEFLKEVEVLSQIRHPHVVLLLGACPERGCLVYEFLENGSLDEYILQQRRKPPLPWLVRFRIIHQVACGVSFLHNSKPEPIIHRDLKPGNILLDRNYVVKIADVGLAKITGEIVPDNITEYKNSIIFGTLHYMDPEYQRTGTVRPKSDLYAFGVIILQMLTARRPHGLILAVENAISSGSLADILDKSVSDWPLFETEELAKIALGCTKLRCRDRPDLDLEVMPILDTILNVAEFSQKILSYPGYVPSHYLCPILQEVMEEPHIAADGFTYEYEAIKAWLNRHEVSPVTKLRLEHSMVTPNHTLRSAIQEWKSSLKLPRAQFGQKQS